MRELSLYQVVLGSKEAVIQCYFTHRQTHSDQVLLLQLRFTGNINGTVTQQRLFIGAEQEDMKKRTESSRLFISHHTRHKRHTELLMDTLKCLICLVWFILSGGDFTERHESINPSRLTFHVSRPIVRQTPFSYLWQDSGK